MYWPTNTVRDSLIETYLDRERDSLRLRETGRTEIYWPTNTLFASMICGFMRSSLCHVTRVNEPGYIS